MACLLPTKNHRAHRFSSFYSHSCLAIISPQISETVLAQNVRLDSLQQHAAQNAEEIIRQRKKVKEREKNMMTSIFGSMLTIVYVAIVFILTYIVIRLFPKPKGSAIGDMF